MKKLFILTLVAVFALAMLSGCGGSKGTSATTPYNELSKMAQAMRKAGALADVGQGQSSREDLARQKAQNDGRAKLALGLESKIQVLQKSFLEEVGSAGDTEVNEAFSSVSKTMASTTLRGVFPEEEKNSFLHAAAAFPYFVRHVPTVRGLFVLFFIKKNVIVRSRTISLEFSGGKLPLLRHLVRGEPGHYRPPELDPELTDPTRPLRYTRNQHQLAAGDDRPRILQEIDDDAVPGRYFQAVRYQRFPQLQQRVVSGQQRQHLRPDVLLRDFPFKVFQQIEQLIEKIFRLLFHGGSIPF